MHTVNMKHIGYIFKAAIDLVQHLPTTVAATGANAVSGLARPVVVHLLMTLLIDVLLTQWVRSAQRRINAHGSTKRGF